MGLVMIMFKFIKKIRGLAKHSPLSKLKVFYQILIIIVIMVVFLGIQGYADIQVMNTLQETTQVIYNETANKLNEISQLKLDLEQLRIYYIETAAKLDDSDPDISPSMDQLNKVKLKVGYIAGLNNSGKKIIYENIETIRVLLTQPINTDNYGQLTTALMGIKIYIDNAYSEVFTSALKTISHNETFSARSQRNTVLLMIIGASFSVIMGLIIVNAISAPLKTMESAANSLAVGDLSHDIDTTGGHEVKRAIECLNKAIAGLRELVQEVNHYSTTLFTDSNEMKRAASESSISAQQIAMSMEELARASSEQSHQITESVKVIEYLSELVTKVSNDTANLTISSERIAQSAQIGQRVTSNVATEIHELYQTITNVSHVINDLNKTSAEINEITTLIEAIAEQTSLLALNASIEAARAKEHGKGFGVVAAETGKLADQSRKAAVLIEDMIEQMKNSMGEAVKIMVQSIKRVELGKDLVNEATDTFEKIFYELNSNLAEIEAVARSAQQMARSNQTVIDAISMIAAISEQSLASTEEVSATAEEQSASMQELTALADNLAQIAENLRQSVARFTLEKGTSDITADRGTR